MPGYIPGIYVFLALIFFLLEINLSAKRSQDLLDRFSPNSPYDRYLITVIVVCRFDPLLPMAQETLPWQPILGKNGQNRTIHLYSQPWHSETVCNIAILVFKSSSAMSWLHLVKIC